MKSFEEISKMNLAELDRPEEDVQDTDGTQQSEANTDTSEHEDVSAEQDNNVEQTEAAEELAKKEMMEPQGKHFRIDAEITQQELTTFLFGHTYRQPLMILVTILAIAWPVAILVKKQGSLTMPLICSLFILIWIPLTTYLRAKNAKKLNTAYQHTFHYMLDEWGLHLELGDEAIDVEWKKVTKVIFYKSVAVIYTGKNNAFLIPSTALGERRAEILSFIEEMKNK